MRTRTKAIVVTAISGLAIMAAGCGSSPSGTYTVNETAGSASFGAYGFPSQCQSTQINLSLQENSNTVTAQGSNSCFSSETLFATNSNGTLTGVTLTLTVAPQTSAQNCSTVYPYSCTSGLSTTGLNQSITCTYTGSLTLSNNDLQGSLSSQLSTTGISTTSTCPQQLTLSGAKTG